MIRLAVSQLRSENAQEAGLGAPALARLLFSCYDEAATHHQEHCIYILRFLVEKVNRRPIR